MRSRTGGTVAGRVLAVLDVFLGGPDIQSLSDIARRSGLPLSTTHRLVRELTAWGALERDEDGRYRVGLRLWEVASRTPQTVRLRDAALPFLEDLYEATHENVQLAVLDGTDAIYVERLSGRRAVHVVTRVGSRLPLHATGVGLVLLAYSPLELRQRVLREPLARYTEHTVIDPVCVRRTLAEVRRNGFVVSDRQIETVSQSIAAPVFGARDQIAAALSIVVPAQDEARRYVPAVMTAARGLSRVLRAGAAVS